MEDPVPIPNQDRVPHSDEFADLVNSLLMKDPRARLQGADQVLNHPWFVNEELEAYIPIDRISNRVEKPVVPDSFFEDSNLDLFDLEPTDRKYKESMPGIKDLKRIQNSQD